MKFLSSVIPLLFSLLSLHAAAQDKFVGSWEGKLNVGVELRLVFHINQVDGGYEGTMDSPDQGMKGMKLSRVVAYDDSLIVDMNSVGASYRGKTTTSEEIQGKFVQKGMSFPLTLKKTEKPSTFNRPQTPQPPFDYGIEDITYYNTDSSIRYGATITLPKGKGPFPAMMLISGSGQQNRDSELFGHKLFAVIADHLTKNGYIVLRADDRGMGQTTGKLATATTADFAQDAEFGINYLKKRIEVDNSKIGLVGHSEGGMIAEMIAAKRSDISFMILMAAPGVSNMQLLEDQNAALYEKAGLSNDKVEAYRKLYRNIVKAGVRSKDTVALYKAIAKVVADWKKKTPADVVLATTGISDEASERKFVQTFTDAFAKPWYKYFAAYDPKSNLQKTNAKILALNGDKDLQVVASSNVEGIRKALAKGKTKSFEVKVFPGLNHLFQTCKTCTIAEYAQLEETIAPLVLKAMKEWLDKEVK